MNNPTRFTALQLAALATIQLGATADVALPARTVLSLDRRGFLVRDLEGNLRIAAASGDKVIDAANREALRMTGIVRRIVRNLVHCTLENQSEAMAERDALDREYDGKVEPMESRIRNEVDFHLDGFDSYSRGEFGKVDGTLADVTYALARAIARKIARKIVDEVLGADIAVVVAMYRKSVVPALERYHAENGPCFGYLAIGTKPEPEPEPEPEPAPKVEPAPRPATREEKRAATLAGVTCETFGQNMNVAIRADRIGSRILAREAAQAALDIHARWGHLEPYAASAATLDRAREIVARNTDPKPLPAYKATVESLAVELADKLAADPDEDCTPSRLDTVLRDAVASRFGSSGFFARALDHVPDAIVNALGREGFAKHRLDPDLTARARNPRPSDCMPDDPDARDVDVSIIIGGVACQGEATLRRSTFDGEFSAWGQPDHWISGDLLEALRDLDDRHFAVACGNIEAAAIHAIANDPDPSDDNPPSRPENPPSRASTPLDPSSGMREAAAHYARTFPARKPTRVTDPDDAPDVTDSLEALGAMHLNP